MLNEVTSEMDTAERTWEQEREDYIKQIQDLKGSVDILAKRVSQAEAYERKAFRQLMDFSEMVAQAQQEAAQSQTQASDG